MNDRILAEVRKVTDGQLKVALHAVPWFTGIPSSKATL